MRLFSVFASSVTAGYYAQAVVGRGLVLVAFFALFAAVLMTVAYRIANSFSRGIDDEDGR